MDKLKIARKNHRYLSRNREVVNRAKTRPCADCGVQYNPWVMHLDHRDPSAKSFTISNHRCGLKRLLEEIAKCDVRCANCHAERTHKQALAGSLPRIKGSAKV